MPKFMVVLLAAICMIFCVVFSNVINSAIMAAGGTDACMASACQYAILAATFGIVLCVIVIILCIVALAKG